MPLPLFSSFKVKRPEGVATTNRALDDILKERHVSVMDFGAQPVGSSFDSLPAFEEAAEWLLARGGGTLWVPPTDSQFDYFYLSDAFNPANCPSGVGQNFINICGDVGYDFNGSKIVANRVGGVIETQPSPQLLKRMSGLYISNSHAAGTGLIYNGNSMGVIEHCDIHAAAIGILCSNEAYQVQIRNSRIHGFGNNGIGIQGSQIHTSQSSIVGWNIGIQANNAGHTIQDCRFEVNRCAVRLGLIARAIATCTSSGGNLTIDTLHSGTIAVGQHIMGGWGIENNNYTTVQSGAGSSWVTNHDVNASSTVLIFSELSQLTGFHFKGNSFERNDMGLDIVAAAALTVDNACAGGPVGVYREITTLSWSSAGGGTATATMTIPHYITTGTKVLTIETPVGFEAWAAQDVTCTITSATTFTYAIVGDPGAAPATSSSSYSRSIQNGIRVRSCSGAVFNGCIMSGTLYEGYAWDLYCDSNTSGGDVVFNGCNGTWKDPPSNMKATFLHNNCGSKKIMLVFNELPGEVSGPSGWTAVAGMEFWITDMAKSGGGTALMGDATQTGGTQTGRVSYNGTAWIRTA